VSQKGNSSKVYQGKSGDLIIEVKIKPSKDF